MGTGFYSSQILQKPEVREDQLISFLTVDSKIREFEQRRPRRLKERQNSNKFIKRNIKFARASRFFVHFFAVAKRLRRENA